MPQNHDLNKSQPAHANDVSEVFSPQEDLRPTNEYLTRISDHDEDYCVMRCSLPAGAVVPMHSHIDRETFYVISGKIEGLRGDRWQELGPGDVFDVRDGTKHAWKNASRESAVMICVTTPRLGRFLRDISTSPAASSPEEDGQRFLRLVREHGYWLASPEENAAVGLDVSWGPH